MWVLILLVYVGGFSDRESNTLATVTGFTSQATCNAAGNAASTLHAGAKSVSFVCVPVK